MNTKIVQRLLIAFLFFSLVTLGFTQDQETSGTPPAPAPSQPETPAPALTPATSEIIKLADTGVEKDQLLSSVQNRKDRFDLNADDVIYLRDVGIENDVIDAMLRHDESISQTQTAPPPSVAAAPETARQPEPAPAPRTTVRPAQPETVYVQNAPTEVRYFYDDLSPYGTWVNIEDYGWAWQPNVVVVNHSWRPYTDHGQWIWTDGGWYWASDYSWGWAPFHYGRWLMRPHVGWVWFPDTTWGPSWVTWRTHESYCGWAPLPPGAFFDAGVGFRFRGAHVGLDFDFGLSSDWFTFTAFGNFRDRNLAARRLEPRQVNQFFGHTTVINNYYSGPNKVVINRGIGVDRVAAATRTKIEPVKIIAQSHPMRTGVAANRVVKDNTTVAVVRTELPKPKTGAIVAEKVTPDQKVVPRVPAVISTRTPTPKASASERIASAQKAARETTQEEATPGKEVAQSNKEMKEREQTRDRTTTSEGTVTRSKHEENAPSKNEVATTPKTAEPKESKSSSGSGESKASKSTPATVSERSAPVETERKNSDHEKDSNSDREKVTKQQSEPRESQRETTSTHSSSTRAAPASSTPQTERETVTARERSQPPSMERSRTPEMPTVSPRESASTQRDSGGGTPHGSWSRAPAPQRESSQTAAPAPLQEKRDFGDRNRDVVKPRDGNPPQAAVQPSRPSSPPPEARREAAPQAAPSPVAPAPGGNRDVSKRDKDKDKDQELARH
jgi:hypothetical protein